MTDGPMPMDRFDWERIIRRTRMPGSRREMALILATFADGDGTRVRPGNEVLAAITGKTERTIIRTVADLTGWGFLLLVRRGGGRGRGGRANEYRLACPPDLLDRFNLLGPNLRPDPQKPSAPTNPGDTQMSPQSDDNPPPTPVDNDHSPVDSSHESVDNPMVPEPSRTPIEVTSDDTSKPIEVTSRCRTTNHLDQTKEKSPSQGDLRPHAHARAPPPHPRPPSTHPEGHPMTPQDPNPLTALDDAIQAAGLLYATLPALYEILIGHDDHAQAKLVALTSPQLRTLANAARVLEAAATIAADLRDDATHTADG